MLVITLLGTPSLVLDGEAVHIRRRKSRALLYYLAAQTQPVRREHLLSLLWPALDRAAAQQSLRTTLHGLRQVFADWLSADDDLIGLVPAAEVDVRQLEQQLTPPAADAGRLRATLDLYRGEFLAGFSLPDAPDFDDWLVAQAEHYRRLYVRGLAALADRYESRGDYPAALDALDRALTLDPLQEDLQRAALRAHYLAGDRAGAIRRYDHLRRLLDEEMGVPPMAETRALYDAIVNDTPIAALTPSPPPLHLSVLAPTRSAPPELVPFTGRKAELGWLAGRAAQEPHKLALVEGEGGIGKTRLIEEYIAASGRLALFGTAHELEQGLPYQPLIEGLRSLHTSPDWNLCCDTLRAQMPEVWQSEIARLLPELLPDQPPPLSPPDEARLWEAMSQFVQALARYRPLIVCVDDVQWADSSTLALLSYLIRKTASPAIVFVATLRPDSTRPPLAALLQTLIRADRLARLHLERLNNADVTAIAGHLSPDYSYPLADWLIRSSEGNPYVLTELIRHAREKELLRPDGTVNLDQLSASPIVPQTVYSLIQARLAQLSDAARRMLDAAVAVGREFEVEVAFRAAGLSETAALSALEELHAAGIIRPRDPARYRFDHSLTLEVAYREMGEARHRLLHRRVAEALAVIHRRDADSVAGLIAFHYLQGSAPELAAPYAFRAGQLAAELAAWAEAIEFFEQALAGELDDRRRFEILMALGSVHFSAGHVPQASETLRDAVRLAEAGQDAVGACNARLRLAETLFSQARFAEAIALAERYPTPDDVPGAILAAQAEFTIGTALSLEGADLAASAAHLRRGEDYLRVAMRDHPDAAIDPITMANLDFQLGTVAAQQGDLARAIELYRSALTSAEQSTHPEATLRLVLVHNNLAYHMLLAGDPAAAEHARLGLELSQQAGVLTMQPYLYSTLGEIALAAGDLDTAEHWFEEGVVLAEQTQNLERIAGLTANLGLVARERGANVLAIHRFSTALVTADSLGTRHLATQIRIWLAPLLPPREGRAMLAEAQAAAQRGGHRLLLEQAERAAAQLADG